MDILRKFTIKNLLLNKKRTIVTIIGIMLSTALICGVASIVTSFQASLIKMVKDDVGDYHVTFKDVPINELKYIEKNVKVESSFLTNQIGYAYLEGSQNVYKPYLSVLEYDKQALTKKGIKLIEGRLPQNSNEVVISDHIRTNGRVNLNVGDVLEIAVGTRQLTNGEQLTIKDSYFEEDSLLKEEIVNTKLMKFKIVGIIERPDYVTENYSAAGYTIITYMDKVVDKANISVRYVKSSEYIENNKMIDEANYGPDHKYEKDINSELLRYEGTVGKGTMKALLGIASIVIVIIVVSSVFVIRNSFSISVAEKNRQYGMLSSIGATSKQIKKNVIFEGFIIGLIAIPLGIICGMIAIAILLQIVNYLLVDSLRGMKFIYSVPLIPILITIVIAFITIYLSCIIPAIRASKISPIESVRGNNDIKIKAKKLKTPKYIKKIFGIGGVIAVKNLKRSRKKYRTTVISIVVSVVIFISLSSFIHYGNVVSNVYYTEMNYNIEIKNNDNNEDTYNKISKLNGVEEYSYIYESSCSINANKYATDFGKEMFDTMEGTTPYISVIAYNDEYFKKYLKSIGIDEKMYDKGVVLIDDVIVNETDSKKVVKNIYNIKDNQVIDINIKGKNDKSVLILNRTEQRTMGMEHVYYTGGALIVSQSYIDDISEYNLGNLFIKAKDATKFENTVNDLIKTDKQYSEIGITNYDAFTENQNKMVLVISIFLYGFITVITLIGVTNIFNTITTNMILRSKEFAMLKSIGMTQKEFNKMIRLESILYGTKALLIGIPIGLIGSYLMYLAYAEAVDYGFDFPIMAVVISIVSVFSIVGFTMNYSLRKINKQNIIDAIRNDNI